MKFLLSSLVFVHSCCPEGAFYTSFSGPGTVWITSMPFSKFKRAVAPPPAKPGQRKKDSTDNGPAKGGKAGAGKPGAAKPGSASHAKPAATGGFLGKMAAPSPVKAAARRTGGKRR